MKKEVCCVNTIAVLDYFKKNRGDCSELLRDLDPEIDALGDPEAYLRDPNNWVSCEIAVNLFDRIKHILQDDMASYKVAKFSIDNSSLGYIQKAFVKAFWSYKTALKHAQKVNDKFNRSKKVELVEIKRNEAVVRLHWDDSMVLSKDLCWMNRGIYTFMPTIWGGLPLELTETCCQLEGSPYCEYYLRWPARNMLHEIVSRFFKSKSVLLETLSEIEEDKKLVERKYEEVRRLNSELDQKINQLQAIQETGKSILSILDLDDLLADILGIISNVCLINLAVIMLVNEEENCLEFAHGIGLRDEIIDEVKDYRVSLYHLDNILVRVVNSGQSEYVSDVESSNLRKENILIAFVKPISAYVVPLLTRGNVIGVIATDAVNGKGVPKETREVLEIFAPQIAIAIENARLYRKLKEQMAEIKESNALLNRTEKISFLGNLAARLAHEIKNPMTAIGTFIQMLPYKFDDDEFRNDFYNIAMEETKRVENLISELLDLVKAREPLFELIDLTALVDKMILLISAKSDVNSIKIIRRFDPNIGKVWVDPEKMKQVILNIISNAIECVPKGGKVEILIKKDLSRGKDIFIEIKDNGPGIPPSIIDKVFDPYFTTKHKSSMNSGTGLGLFIAHQNMQDHGGTISVKSSVNKGARFTLRLPSKNSSIEKSDTIS
ncbi:ATP-binding protein [Thermodesulfobacteriota bacterium]